MQNLKCSPACTQHLLNSTLISCSYPIPRNCKRTDRSALFPLPSIDVSALFLSGSVLDSFCLPCESIMAASASSRELFTEGVRAVLSTWPVLQIAVDNGFGGVYGQQKADWLVDVVQQYFHDNTDLQQYEVEDFIAQLMDQEFNTVVDDESLPQVSVSLMQLFDQWRQGALQQIRNTINTLAKATGQRAKVTAPPPESSDDDGDDETQAMECESSSPSVSSTAPPPAPPSQDEADGWTVVRKKK